MRSSLLIKVMSVTSLCAYAFMSQAAESKSPLYFEIGTGQTFNSGKNTSPNELSSSDSKFNNKTSVPISASLGYKATPNVRFDINFTYLPEWNINLQGNDSEGDQVKINSSISSLTSGINGYYDFTNVDNIGVIPYLTGGIGFSFNKMGDSQMYINDNLQAQFSSNNTTNFMWKVGFGATKKINDFLFVDIGYRFVSLGEAKSKAGSIYRNDGFYYNSDTLNFKDLYSHQILVNMGFNF